MITRAGRIADQLDTEHDGNIIIDGNSAGFEVGIIEDSEFFAAHFGSGGGAGFHAVPGVFNWVGRALEIEHYLLRDGVDGQFAADFQVNR
jgi:hypothetical protein